MEFKNVAGHHAPCCVCGVDKDVCCDNGYYDHEDGSTTHDDPVCRDCCPHHGVRVVRGDRQPEFSTAK